VSRLAGLLERWRAGEIELAPVTSLLGVRPVAFGDGEARLAMTAGRQHHNAMGTVHGGILCDLADAAMGVALATLTADGESFTTLQLQMSYFLPVVEGHLAARARVVRRGRTTAHLDCDLADADGRLFARATSVCAIRRQG
jgi:uncharacterized protein (TIGR00369 family)